jgi:hypothetical protein
MFPEGISNGNAHAENVIRVKLAVVENVVPMRLRTNEEVSPRGVLHANAKMQKEMVAVQASAAAASRNVAIVHLVVEQQ